MPPYLETSKLTCVSECDITVISILGGDITLLYKLTRKRRGQ